MREEFLYYLWKSGQLFQKDLRTTNGKKIQVIRPGYRNRSEGPDFFSAQLKIGQLTWHGQVEFHLRSSDWNAHGHQNDPRYNNVILHVVMEDDKKIFTQKGSKLPTLEIRNHADPAMLKKFVLLEKKKGWIPCDPLAPEKNLDFCWPVYLSRIGLERMEEKANRILRKLRDKKGDWDAVTADLTGRYLIGKANGKQMDELLRGLPFNLLLKNSSHLTKLEALVFGRAGFLKADCSDSYFQTLKSHFQHLSRLYGIKSMDSAHWKFMPVRPPSFPTIRLAQWCTLIGRHPRPLSVFLPLENAGEVKEKLRVPASSYWETHYNFGKKSSRKRNPSIGKSTLKNLLINVAAPVVFAYGLHTGNEELRERAVHWLESERAEHNSIVHHWKKRKVKASNAMDSQALIQLKSAYCDKSRCLECGFGARLLSSEQAVEIAEEEWLAYF